MFVWTDLAVLKLFLHLLGKKEEEEENLAPLDLSASPQVKMGSTTKQGSRRITDPVFWNPPCTQPYTTFNVCRVR